MKTTIAIVNKQSIVIVNDNNIELVPVRPICEALGIDFSAQLQRIKRDEILSSTVVTVTTVGADEKNREMVTIPLEFVFGWLFTIDTNQVKVEVKDTVIQYKLECYKALYNYFNGYRLFEQNRKARLHEITIRLKETRSTFSQTKQMMKRLEEETDMVLLEDYLDTFNTQLQLNFDEESEVQS